MTPRIQVVRFHESGHALVAALGGLDVRSISAVPRGRVDGSTAVQIPKGESATPESRWADLVMTLAGLEAVRALVLRGVGDPVAEGGDDHVIAVRVAESLADDGRSTIEILRDAREEAQALARRLRPAIIALAGTLEANGDHLDGSEVRPAIDAALAGRSWYRGFEGYRASLHRDPEPPPAIPTVPAFLAGRDWVVTRTSTGFRRTRAGRPAGVEER